ncbi:MAG: YebC/PmpR family DNA-binding transcriptional regulator [Ruminococcaceae bacterium]|nr:YebC/PmpR family DNA-binding transcriptional regulator [Oscillospiraceae bacterium]
MSGHSKWNNIKRKKEKTDAQKAKVFTRIGKEMAVAIRAGGPNPNNNGKLRDLIAKAKANNVPNDNIERIIKKFSDDDSINYEEITYEGYGAAGVAVIVETATDNRNRTAGNLRSYFSKFHGNMGQNGCVSFMFTEKGLIEIADEDNEIDEDKLMEDALEAGAADFEGEDGYYSIYTELDDLVSVTEALQGLGYKIESSDRAMIPSTYVDVTDEEDIKMLELLLEKLDDDDDVQNVFHNWNN